MPQNIDPTLRKRSGMADKPILLRWLDKRLGESIQHRRQGVPSSLAECCGCMYGLLLGETRQEKLSWRWPSAVVQRRLAYGLRSRIVRMSHYLHFVPFMHVILPGDAATLTVARSDYYLMMPGHKFVSVMPRSFLGVCTLAAWATPLLTGSCFDT